MSAPIKSKRYQKPDEVKVLENWALKNIKKKNPHFPYPVKPKYTDKTANGLTKCIIDTIRLSGYQAERINSIGRPIESKITIDSSLGKSQNANVKWIKGSSQNGTADISATIKGRSVKIEVKCKYTGDNYQSQDQKEYQKSIEKAGGIYIVVRDFPQFAKWIKQFLNNGR